MVEEFVMFDRGASTSRADIVCRASTVADGGVFSPNMAFGGGRVEGRKVGVSFVISRPAGVGVLVGLFSGELKKASLSRVGVPERPSGRSGDLSGDRTPSK